MISSMASMPAMKGRSFATLGDPSTRRRLKRRVSDCGSKYTCKGGPDPKRGALNTLLDQLHLDMSGKKSRKVNPNGEGHTNGGFNHSMENILQNGVTDLSISDYNDEYNEYGQSQADDKEDPILLLNIGGTRFEVLASTLKSIPNTRLCTLAKLQTDDKSYRVKKEEYFFDRNPSAFLDILEFYRRGELHMDQVNCGTILLKELDFWGLKESDISICCWAKYNDYQATSKMYEELDELFDDGISDAVYHEDMSRLKKLQFYLFNFLENPKFSVASKIFLFLSISITLMSIFGFVSETHWVFQQIRLENGTYIPAPKQEMDKSSSCCCNAAAGEAAHSTNHTPDVTVNNTHNETEIEHSTHLEHYDAHIILHYIDFFTYGYFVVELILRFTVAYNKRGFFLQPLNAVEVICIIAHSISLIEHAIADALTGSATNELFAIFILRSLRIMRIARVFKLFRHMTGFKVLLYTIRVSTSELLLVISFLMAGVLIFASIMHYAEEETFPNIPFAIWWSLVTMITVGYGDVTPNTNLGYCVGALCVISGVLVIAFTVPIVVNNFTLYYALCKSRQSRLISCKMSSGDHQEKSSFDKKTETT